MDMKVAVLEYRVMLQSCQVFLKFNHVLNENEIDIVILDNKIIIKYIDTKENTKLPQSITLDTSSFFNLNSTSVSGLSYSNDEITFRLQTEPKDKTEGSFKTQIVTKYCENQCKVSDKYKINIEENTAYEFICRNCSSDLFLTKGFTRVLELPTEILDMCDWFCHKHDTKTNSFRPEINELFYKNNYIVINESLANFKHNKSSNSISCPNCQNTIGSKKDNINIYNFAVQLKQDKNICDIYSYKKSTCIILQDFIYLTKKLVGDEALLLMLMCKICFKATDTENKLKYILLKVIDLKTQVLKTNDQGILELKSVVKLMYKVEDEGGDTYNKWKIDKDFTFTLEEIPYQMFLKAEKYLQLMSEYIPSSCQNIDDFKLCYLDL